MINATGVALSTNLGRAPLAEEAVAAAVAAAGYATLEWDAERGSGGTATPTCATTSGRSPAPRTPSP